MDVLMENLLFLSPLLVLPALVQRKWNRPLAVFGVAVIVALLATILAAMPLNGPGDAAVGRGIMVIYGWGMAFLLTLAAGIALIWSAGRKSERAGNPEAIQRESSEMFNRATGEDRADG